MNFDLGPYSRVARYFPYRSAATVSKILVVDYEHQDAIDLFHQWLAQEAGRQKDNKTVYELAHSDGTVLYVMFYDWAMTIATSIHVHDPDRVVTIPS